MDPAFNESVAQLIALARKEDVGQGDVTTALMAEPDAPARFQLVAKQKCVLAGVELVPQILASFDADIRIEWSTAARDGASIAAVPNTLGVLSGRLGAILTAERTTLNFFQRLCGIATLTRRFVDAVAGTGAKIYDTRKTIPGWRSLEKYAVRCGGGNNHRLGLFDAVLIKDNHLAGVGESRLAATVFDMLNRLSSLRTKPAFVEVEATSVGQVRELCKVIGIDVILLDNFSLAEVREAVAWRSEAGLEDRIAFEVSGGVHLDTVRAIAETGVERISVGAITHSAVAVDLCLDRAPC